VKLTKRLERLEQQHSTPDSRTCFHHLAERESSERDLAPCPDCGWYDKTVALEWARANVHKLRAVRSEEGNSS
jgi:hypothetical protein